jgi:hypothetical protein
MDWSDPKLKTSTMGLGAVNDMGVMTPDNLQLHFYAGFKGKKLMQSFGLIGSIPMGNGYTQLLSDAKTEEAPDAMATSIDVAQFYIDNKLEFAEVWNDDLGMNDTVPVYLYVNNDGYWTTDSILVDDSDPTAIDTVRYDPLYDESAQRVQKKKYSTYASYKWEVLRVENTEGDSSQIRIRERIIKPQKSWFTLTPGYGMEIFDFKVPVFFAFTLPIEFNMDEGVGVKGFQLDVGIKFVVF